VLQLLQGVTTNLLNEKMKQYRYILEPYKGMNTRYHCPECNHKQKTFSRYIDIETGEYIHPSVGRCNRENNCGYHYQPKQYFDANRTSFDAPNQKKYPKVKPSIVIKKSSSFIPVELFKGSLNNYTENNFVKFLFELFGKEITTKIIEKYYIGTSKHWEGATIFWQIDISGKIRTGKIIQYKIIPFERSIIEKDCKRVKTNTPPIYWVHSALKVQNFNLQQCFFGEHLLKTDLQKPVAIVESEKTAIIASVYIPEFIWLAVGGLNNLNIEKCTALKGRNILLFPDLRGFEKWEISAKKISLELMGIKFINSDLLEKKATEIERQQGLDLADYLIKFNYKEFHD
jgi:hypothetical protein